jgi:hypothetical protein
LDEVISGLRVWIVTFFVANAMLLLSVPRAGLAAGAANQSPVGFVIISRGDAQRISENRQVYALKRRSQIFSGDEIRTGASSGLQLKFIDGSIIALQANTRLQISQFQYAPENADSRSFFKLLEGGIRAISGAIGKMRPENYRMQTPIATIGIRGTHYAVAMAEKMFVGVWEGGVRVTNEAGSLDLGSDSNYRFAAIAGQNQLPIGLIQQPQEINQLIQNLEQKPSPRESSEQTSTDSEGEESASVADVLQSSVLDSLLNNLASNLPYPRADYPRGALLSFSARTDDQQTATFGHQGVISGVGSVENDPRLLLYPNDTPLRTDPYPAPTWIASNADDTLQSLFLVGLQSQMIPEGVAFGRWNVSVESNPAGDSAIFSLTPKALWLTADLSSPLADAVPHQYRVTMPLFFSGDSHNGSDALRVANLDLTIDFNDPSALSGEMTVVSQGANGAYETELWHVDLTGNLNDRALHMQVDTSTSTLSGSGANASLDGELRGFLVEDGASLVGNVKLWDAAGDDLWLNAIVGATGIETRLTDAERSAYLNNPTISLAASASNNNLGITSPLFRHDEGVFAGPAIINNNTLLRIADLWHLEDLTSTEFLGVEYFISAGTLTGLLSNVTPIDPLGDGVSLPQMPSLHLANAWSEAVFAYDPLESDATQAAPSGERLVWLLSRPASLTDLNTPRLGLFDTVAYAYFEDASAASGDKFTFTLDSSALADFNAGTLNDFNFRIRTATQQFDIQIAEGFFQDSAGARFPSIDLADDGVRGTVCDLSDCSNTRREAHGEIRLSFLENGRTLGGSLKLWEDGDLNNWISGVFTLAEDIRLSDADITGLQQGEYAFMSQAGDEGALTNTFTGSAAFTLSGDAITDTFGAPTLIKDPQLSVGGTLFRNAGFVNVDVGSGTIGGQRVGWGRWNRGNNGNPTVESDFTNRAQSYDKQLYWISARPTAESDLPVGTAIYNSNVRMLGQLNGEDILRSPSSGTEFKINFNDMTMHGALGLSDGDDENATITVTGSLEGPLLRADTIEINYNNAPISTATSEFNGAVIGNNGEGLAGAWHSQDPAFNSTSGVFVVEQQ